MRSLEVLQIANAIARASGADGRYDLIDDEMHGSQWMDLNHERLSALEI